MDMGVLVTRWVAVTTSHRVLVDALRVVLLDLNFNHGIFPLDAVGRARRRADRSDARLRGLLALGVRLRLRRAELLGQVLRLRGDLGGELVADRCRGHW